MRNRGGDYVALADRIAEDIRSGRLRPGDRLPPQRIFAHREGIAASTASRVYGDLARRALVAGEVGRGTFVRSAPALADPPLIEPTSAPVDLELIFPMPADDGAALGEALARLATSGPIFRDALRPIGAGGTAAAREAAAAFLERRGWAPSAGAILFAGNGRQAIAGALAALVGPGDRIAVEALTYPVAKGIASRLGAVLVPVETDAEGMLPGALAAAHRAAPLAAIYLQPSLHSPLGCTMGRTRRVEIAELLRQLNIPAVEDGVYSFLAEGDLPLAALAPERVMFVDSLSKRVAPGLTLGLVAAPGALVSRVAAALRSGAWSASGLPLAVGAAAMADGSARAAGEAKRTDARARRALAGEVLGRLGLVGDARAYHAWLPLPETWRAEAFVAAALRFGIALTPGSSFAAEPGYAPGGVRLALASPPLPVLRDALNLLARLVDGEVAAAETE